MSSSHDPVSMRPCKRLCVVPSSEGEDHISDLPDGAIGLILSLVPIKDAVRTSVLSRDWEHKWTFMRDIEVIDKCKISEAKTAQFINFVTRVLNRTRNSTLRRFSLTCYHKYDASFLETWISTVLSRNVENLEICGYQVGRLDSRWCFSGWTSLVELNISLSCTLVIPFDNYCFRKLRKLHLLPVHSHGNLKIKTAHNPTGGCIVLTFPVLQSLSLEHCEWLDVKFVEIHAPELTSFKTRCLVERKNHEIKILAAKLALFESHGIENFDLHTPAVSSVKLFHVSPSNEQEYQTILLPRFESHKILKQVSDVKYLELSGNFVKAFKALKLPSPMSRLVYPTFGRLEELHLCSPGYSYEDTVILLQLLPPLVHLTVGVLFWEDNCERGESWQPKIVSNLKTIKVVGFCLKDVQFDFSKFVFENASNLEDMRVHLREHVYYLDLIDDNIKVYGKLGKLKPQSPRCRIVVEFAENQKYLLSPPI